MDQPLHVDPLLGEISELLHRMTTSEDKALGWLAWNAIKKLRTYEEGLINQRASAGEK